MTLILNDVFIQFNHIVGGRDPNSDLGRKMIAVNEGLDYLTQRLIDVGRTPTDMLEGPTDLSNTALTNFVSLPDNFSNMQTLWRKSVSGDYEIIPKLQIVTFNELKIQKGPLFFSTIDTGDASFAAYSGLNIFFDRHFADIGTDNIRIHYTKLHDFVEAFDRITVTGVLGIYIVGETITGSLSNATGVIKAFTATTIDIETSTRNGTFLNTDTITGMDSAATSTQVGVMVEKAQLLNYSDSFKLLVVMAISTLYLILIGSTEVIEKSNILDELIQLKTNIRDTGTTVLSISRSGR